ncbi:tRNA threonylcarbamoyladenosine dehydratase [Hominifimenecus sp. rT4P-3]|uniref:tRNA threonylcarbamoyladenosine dehydratase n=1 Tax=Hominifimenecus sp. rT4P-3 TaxID=3242979 RepID=UPI003DA51002
MLEEFLRTELLFGPEAMEKLSACRVAVFGIGGVGGHAAEALARSGIGAIDLIDPDIVSVSNRNRQIVALQSTVGRYKVDVMRERILDINPDIKVRAMRLFYLPETADDLNLGEYDYIVDAVDTVTAKLELAVRARKAETPLISCMGAGNKLDPTRFVVTDISKTSVCPLARVMRRELKKRGIFSLKVVYSTEPARTPLPCEEEDGRRAVPGSVAFVPSVAGLIAAGEVVKDLVQEISLPLEMR